MRGILVTTIVLLIGLQADLHAGDTLFRCGSNLVSIGDTMHEIRGSCGEPFSAQVVGERKAFKIQKENKLHLETISYVTEWIYESSNGIYLLTFVGSRLEKKEYIYQ